MANNLEEEILQGIGIGDEVVIEILDSNPVLDNRIIEKSKAGKRVSDDLSHKISELPEKIVNKLKIGERVNSYRTYKARKNPKANRISLRNDLPRDYLIAETLVREAREYIRARDSDGGQELADSIVYPSSEYEQVRDFDPGNEGKINGQRLSLSDRSKLEKLARVFMPLKYGNEIYLVSRRLLDDSNSGISYKSIKEEGLEHAVDRLEMHPDIELVHASKKLEDSQVNVNILYARPSQRNSVFPKGDREHTSLLVENTCESAGNGYGSRAPDEMVKGGDEYFDHLPTPDELETNDKNNSGFSIRKK